MSAAGFTHPTTEAPRPDRRQRPRTWSIPATCRAIGLMYLAVVPGYFAALGREDATVLSFTSGLSGALLLIAGEVILRRRRAGAGPRTDDPVAFGIGSLVLLNSLTHMAIEQEALVSNQLLLLMVAASYFIQSPRWLLPFIGLTLASWVSVAALTIDDFDRVHYAFTTVFTLGLCATLYSSRRAFIEGQLRSSRIQQVQNERMHSALRDAEFELAQRQMLLRRLEAAEARSSAIIEASPDAMILVDHHDRITVANPMAVEIFGYSQDDLIGRSLAETIVPERLRESHLLGMSRYLESGQAHLIGRRIRLPARRADGSEFPAEVRLQEIRVSDGPLLFVGFVSDLTERETAEEALREARDRAEEASRAKSQFLARMSHEIRTPLNAVVGLTNLAIAELPQGRIRELLERSRGAGEYLSAVLGDTLDLSKIEAGRLEVEQRPLSPRNLLEEACDFLSVRAAERGLDLILQVDSNVPDRIIGDSTRIRQIVTNLVGNAIKFTDRGWVRVSMYQWQDRLHIEVEDTGVGVPTFLKRRIFEEFEQGQGSVDNKKAGTGLGLTISRRLAHLLGGVITLEDRSGGGSRFALVLPCIVAGSQPAEASKPPVDRVIVAVSHPVERAAIRENLSPWTIEVVEARDAAHLEEILIQASQPEARQSTAVLFDPESFPLSSCPNPDFEWIAIVRSPATAPPAFTSSALTRPIGPRSLSRLLSDRDPVKQEEQDEQEEHEEAVEATQSPAHRKILIVEDNEINQIVLAEILRRGEHEVEVANDGYEALEILKHTSFDVVLMDISMPGIDGFETLERLRIMPSGQGLPVFAVSAYATQEMRDRVFAAGFDGFMPKPIDAAQILSVLAELPVREDRLEEPGTGSAEVDESAPRPDTQGVTQVLATTDVVDAAILKRHTEGDRALIHRLSQIFDESYPEIAQEISRALNERAWEDLRPPLHKLKGTLGDIGGVVAREHAEALSEAGRAQNHAAAEEAFEQLATSLLATSRRLAEIAAQGGIGR